MPKRATAADTADTAEPENVVPMSDALPDALDTVTPEPEANDDTLANETPAVEEAPKPDWPESTEKRLLSVVLNDAELKSASTQLARTIPDIMELEAQAKSAADTLKAKIKAIECQQTILSNVIRDGCEDRQVDCVWVYECAGVDGATSERIYHPEKKSLFRKDTGEFVECRDITNDERQMALPIAE